MGRMYPLALVAQRHKPMIHLALVDDWELRGDGSGDMRRIQFEAMRKLLDVYERHGLRASFNAEVLQQFAHVESGKDNPEHRALAEEWEASVTGAYARGHDVQLHLHPQWRSAESDGTSWTLAENWSILSYPPDVAKSLVLEGKQYLEGLLRPLDSSYACVSFRSGSWAIAPSDHILHTLVDAGIVFDMSIADGLFYETRHVQLDYRNIEEPFLPYYPVLDDARRVASTSQPIVCVPTHTFNVSTPAHITGVLGRRASRLGPLRRPFRRFVAPSDAQSADDPDGYAQDHWMAPAGSSASRLRRVASLLRGSDRAPRVSDLSALSWHQMRQMLADIRRRATLSGMDVVPIVLENHSKDIADLDPIERFSAHVAAAPDIEVVTLQTLASNLKAGLYPVRTAGAA